MEASEAIRRIFWRQRWLLLILVIVPAVVVVAMREHQPVTYAATANVQGQGITPDTTTQVSAIQSRVAAVATDPAIVQQAITAAGVSANATQVARHEVAVVPLGTSAVMALTVTDRSGPVAVRLAGALAGAVVTQLNQLGIKDNPQLLALNKTIGELTAKRNMLVAQLNSATAAGVPSTSVEAQSLLARLTATEQDLATAQATSQQILAGLSANTGASIVSSPAEASGTSRGALTYGALAALLGLVVGLLIGALREIARPTVAQPAAGARELGTIPLGDARLSGDRVTGIDEDLADRLSLAAHRAGVDTIVLTGPVPHTRLASLAGRLSSELAATGRGGLGIPDAPDAPDTPGAPDDLEAPDAPGAPNAPAGWPPVQVPVRASAPAQSSGDALSRGAATWRHGGPGYPAGVAANGDGAGHQAGSHGGWPRLTVAALPDIRLGDRQRDAALVVALPAFAPHGALDQAGDLCLATDWPILGVIGLRRRGWPSSKIANGMERWDD